MLASLLTYAGLVAVLLGLIFLSLEIGPGGEATMLGAVAAALGLLLPARARRVAKPESLLDDVAPVWLYGERHETHIRADPAAIFRALRHVTASDIRGYRLLTRMRSPWRRRLQASIVAPPAHEPILDVALETGFVVLAEEPDREIVLGTLVHHRPGDPLTRELFEAPGLPPSSQGQTVEASGVQRVKPRGVVKAVLNFRVEPGPEVCRLTTETRVFATSREAGLRFRAYWSLIYPGSAFIRRSWLRAIRQRAERPE